jgi:hypothetical protein
MIYKFSTPDNDTMLTVEHDIVTEANGPWGQTMKGMTLEDIQVMCIRKGWKLVECGEERGGEK